MLFDYDYSGLLFSLGENNNFFFVVFGFVVGTNGEFALLWISGFFSGDCVDWRSNYWGYRACFY